MKRRKAHKDEQLLHYKIIIPYFDNHQSQELLEDSPYRVIAMPEKFTLCDFAEAINESFDFNFDQLFAFYDNIQKPYASKKIYALKNQDYYDKPNLEDVEKAKLFETINRKGKNWLYLFDFDAEWHFWVSLIDRSEANPDTKYPEIIKSYGKAPLQYNDEGDEIDEETFNQKANELIDEAMKSLQKLKSAVTPKLPIRVLNEADKITLLKNKLRQNKLDFNEENFLIYSKYLNKDLEFPFEASFTENTDIFGIVTTKVIINSIFIEPTFNGNDGIRTLGNYGFQNVKVPLFKLQVLAPGSNKRLIAQYKKWFLNKIKV